MRLRGLARSSGVNQTRTSFIPALGRNSLTWLYDPVVALTTREAYFKKELLRQASIPEDAFVLDLGCGTGTLAVLLARSCPNGSIVGLDGDETALRRRLSARTGHPDGQLSMTTGQPYRGDE